MLCRSSGTPARRGSDTSRRRADERLVAPPLAVRRVVPRQGLGSPPARPPHRAVRKQDYERGARCVGTGAAGPPTPRGAAPMNVSSRRLQQTAEPCPGRDSNPDSDDFKSSASANWATGARLQSGTRVRRHAEREMTQMAGAEHPDRAFESSRGAQPQAKARYAFGRAANSSKAARGLERASSAIRSRRNRKLTMSSTNTRILRSHVGIARPW
jgi:hypothetical protein